jgi:hypothetical protein
VAHDPRAAEAMRKFQSALKEVDSLGAVGFARLLDTASKEEMDDLLVSAEVILENILRMKRGLAGGPSIK